MLGGVNRRGFASLHLSTGESWSSVGAVADCWVGENTISVDDARPLVDSVPDAVTWRPVDDHLPGWLRQRLLDDGRAAGLEGEVPERCLLTGDKAPRVGQFVSVCEKRAPSSGIRGVPANSDVEQRVGSEPELSELARQGG